MLTAVGDGQLAEGINAQTLVRGNIKPSGCWNYIVNKIKC